MTYEGYAARSDVWEHNTKAQSGARTSGGTLNWYIKDLHTGRILGLGNTESAAWCDALRHINRESK